MDLYIFSGIIIVPILIYAVFVFGGFRWFKNRIGSLLGYGSCPNCGNSWWLNKYGDIFYDKNSGVLICNYCLKHPDRLDPDHIIVSLIKSRWRPEKAKLVWLAVGRYKSGDKSIAQLY